MTRPDTFLHRLHVRYRWLRYQTNYYDSLWRVLVVRYRMWRMFRTFKRLDRTQPGWTPMPVKQTDRINVRDMTREELDRLLALGERKG